MREVKCKHEAQETISASVDRTPCKGEPGCFVTEAVSTSDSVPGAYWAGFSLLCGELPHKALGKKCIDLYISAWLSLAGWLKQQSWQ